MVKVVVEMVVVKVMVEVVVDTVCIGEGGGGSSGYRDRDGGFGDCGGRSGYNCDGGGGGFSLF